MVKKERKLYKCLRCTYEWLSAMKLPNVCAGCHSPYWDRPKVRFFKPKAKK